MTNQPTTKMVKNIYSDYQTQLTNQLTNYIDRLDKQQRTTTTPTTRQNIIQEITEQLPALPEQANELRRLIISSVFSSLISHLNQNRKEGEQDYTLYHLLDLVLAFIDHGLAAPELALGCIEEILEASTVQQAQFIFGYLESRVQRLTVDMLPDRGKGLIFLRMQNNLLRRLSKSLHTVFCGRILCFLSSVFPIAEKSGVNLRGAFNHGNITKFDQFDSPPSTMLISNNNSTTDEIEAGIKEIEKNTPQDSTPRPNEEIKPDDSARVKASKSATDKREFYTRFWSLQALLSNPPELFKSWTPDPTVPPALPSSSTTTTTTATTSATSATSATLDPNSSQPSTPNLKKLKDGISKTLEVFGRMTKKELELGTSHLHKSEDMDGLEQFFFPKFLTKSNLLDLEIADPYFRRQVLTQFLIILQYIRGFSPEERAKRASLPKSNRISEIPYVYQAKDEAWVLKLSGEVWKTLYATPPHGEIFAMTIQQILIRESSWIMWKAGSCASFEKASLDDLDPAPGYKRITSNPVKFPHPVGTPALSKLWENKVTLDSIENIDPTAGVPDLKTLHLKIQHLDLQLKQLQENLPPDTDPKAETIKSQVQQLQERKTGLSWRALRIAQSSHLQFFGKIGMPADINKLMMVIEESKNRGSVPLSRPVSGMNASPLTTPNLQSMSGSTTTGVEEESMGKACTGETTQELQRVPSNEASQPDVVMLDGESIMESVGGPGGLASELDGELISESLPSVAPPVPSGSTDEVRSATSPVSRPASPQPIPSAVAPTVSTIIPPTLSRHHSHPQQQPVSSSSSSQIRTSPTQTLHHEPHRMSDVEQVIRRMEAQANRSAVGTPTPPPPQSSSGTSGGRHGPGSGGSGGGGGSGDYSRPHHPHTGLLYYHPSLPSHPHHNNHGPRLGPPPGRPNSNNNSNNNSNLNNLNTLREHPGILKRPVAEVIDLEAPDLAIGTDPKKHKN
ncbi:hypothetical protein PGTUg99_009944 [Puccinia graminis f. sp. tritici]|uniref:THO complex subunit 1 n=1 Tax=Puccinia graminis f. sp. tritici TaxID=56615 RepID=A0A5B0QHH0_PUCGR|nr:hypothetical protein PGTUg99_009944 [Puccinia graminis f. sp. tritici]